METDEALARRLQAEEQQRAGQRAQAAAPPVMLVTRLRITITQVTPHPHPHLPDSPLTRGHSVDRGPYSNHIDISIAVRLQPSGNFTCYIHIRLNILHSCSISIFSLAAFNFLHSISYRECRLMMDTKEWGDFLLLGRIFTRQRPFGNGKRLGECGNRDTIEAQT